MKQFYITGWTVRFVLIIVGLLFVQPYPVNSSTQSTPQSLVSSHRDMPLQQNFTAPCTRCHQPDGTPPAADYHARAECIECHLPEKDWPNQMVSLVSNPAADDKTSRPLPDEIKPRVKLPSIISESMIFISSGEFQMGNNGRPLPEGEGDSDESPAHHVYVPGFWMDKYEVTNAQYSKYVQAAHAHSPKHWTNGSYPSAKANHPVVYVDWFDANDYCHWSGKRLPSEEEWEKAARGTDGRDFPWGELFDPQKANTPQYWLVKQEKGDTMPVGSFENGKSPYGLYDMAGNVYEWVANWYKPYPGNQVPNIHYGEKNKILRGGSWYDCLSYGCGLSSPAYNRSRFNPSIKNKGFGFRCAKSSDDRKE
jgi:formylglycine-generating enzyme required for sulfatase activity